VPTEFEYVALRDELFQRFVSGAAVMPELNFFGTSLLPEHNVVGVGVGPKVVGGQLTEALAVRIYVVSKVMQEALPESLLFPTEVAGIAVDVIETGMPRLGQQVVPPNRQRLRPFQPGCSIGFAAPNPAIRLAGTLGALVRDANATYILSNNHVIAAEGHVPVGAPIFQPGTLDGGRPPVDQVASMARFVPISPLRENLVDAAVALVDPGLVLPSFLPIVGQLASADPVAPARGMRVMKTGRTSFFTEGTIEDVSFRGPFSFSVGQCIFTNQVVVSGRNGQPFGMGGDSGSVVVDEATKQATALLFAVANTVTFCNPLPSVLGLLGVRIVV
jgi:hypothetical protein